MDFWTLYLLSRLDGIKDFVSFMSYMSGTVFIIAAIIAIVCTLTPEDSLSKEGERAEIVSNKILKVTIPTFILLVLFTILTPTFKQALVFAGVDYVSNNERVTENVNNTLKVFEGIVEEKLKAISEATE